MIARIAIALAVTQWCVGIAHPGTPLQHAAPPVVFGPGQHRIGADVPPGRYFARPSTGCYWERRSADSRLAFGFVGFDAQQWIVDLRPSDAAFITSDACGRWSSGMVEGPQRSIAPGIWIVGQQIAAGTYISSVRVGCYWERLRDFAGTSESVVGRELLGAPGPAFVTIFGSDAGFRSDAACGTWTLVDAPAPPSAHAAAPVH